MILKDDFANEKTNQINWDELRASSQYLGKNPILSGLLRESFIKNSVKYKSPVILQQYLFAANSLKMQSPNIFRSGLLDILTEEFRNLI